LAGLIGEAPVSGNSYGFAWYQFDERLSYPAAGVCASAVAGGILSEFDVLVMPAAAGLDGALGANRLDELQRWVRRGGVLITLENATTWLRYAPADRLRLAGFLWPEAPARLAGTPALWTERVGSGRVMAFAHDPNFRDLWRGHLALFANAVFLGGSF
jgi:hypothetical protein